MRLYSILFDPSLPTITMQTLWQRSIWSLLLLLMLAGCNQKDSPLQEDQFSLHVRTVDARSPARQQTGFQLPPGFEIQLFAAEPDIAKPLNMAFDDRGRMWLTHTYEYPFADTTGAGKDRISILEDTNGDGRADKFTVFADSLNIPIGIVTVPDGAIAYSIPHIYHFIDKDHDDMADQRKVLYSGFQYNDTHGMVNNFMRSWDGWIHADHGFANTSTVSGSDGDTIVMFSGNTFRFRPDGSRIELTTTGRVNPYGYAYDEMGYTYSVDCHTSPLYQLIRGADYPHFGKKPTGIGFGPAMMKHEYGATALAGLEYYLGDKFPAEYQHSFYMGDVVKSRVYRNTITFNGTTPVAKQEPDFVVSDDPWFRPVDIKLGPDGALYIADFYNRIIGHYEVALDHPGRDRQRGRIWRITYEGRNDANHQDVRTKDLSMASLATLIKRLNDKNLPLRMSIADQIVDRFGRQSIDPILAMMKASETDVPSYIQGLWILFRLNALSSDHLTESLEHPDVNIKVHILRIMFETEALDDSQVEKALESLTFTNPHVQRQAIMVLSRNPRIQHITPLLDLYHSVAGTEDSHLFYTIRQGVRDHLRDTNVIQWVNEKSWTEKDSRVLADLMMGVNNELAVHFLLKHLRLYDEPEEKLIAFLTHSARYDLSEDLDQLITLAQAKSDEDPDLGFLVYEAIEEGLAQGGRAMTSRGKLWGNMLASSFLSDEFTEKDQWRVVPNEHQPFEENPWQLVEMEVPGSPMKIRMLANELISRGGTEVSSIYSPGFTLPESLEFILRGRKIPGEGSKIAYPRNRVELRLIEGDTLIAEVYVDEDETNKKVNWDIGRHTGRRAYLAVVDGSSLRGEFVAIGGINPEVVNLPLHSPNLMAKRQIFAAEIAKENGVRPLRNSLQHLLINQSADIFARASAADALIAVDGEENLALIATILNNETEAVSLKEHLAHSLSELSSSTALTMLEEVLDYLSYDVQKTVALKIIATSGGIDHLLNAGVNLKISPILLLEPQIKEQLLANMDAEQSKKFHELTDDIKPPSEDIQSMINQRLIGFIDAAPSVENGMQVFTMHCSACHQINNQGSDIGPQLDGIGNWGRQAITEKIFDPNRNISKAFNNYTISLADGRVTSGMFRREEGQLMIFANVVGQEFSLPKNEILAQEISPFTLMPDNFRDIISNEEYFDLLAYLLQEN